ncbi:hypothetical protein [Desulfocurvibacter africanus]|uniref:Uncharacterized protein n=1 Tax=Desulfocurvibacter africanus subsp. africanus str. Walvis Bay TaxID=690850 RepID=F3YUX6_DESAF|nr:hypothetical protein [Desulfocurvibacter africanus]EGJ49153.1 hypothetical protein Desaf_0802 [Desulfocurvibacter africanus subsp. africanus str. Walvis Bay]
MRLFVAVALGLPMFCGSGCSYEKILNEFVSNEELAFSEHYFEMFREKNFEEIVKPLNSNLIVEDLHSQLAQMAQFFPADDPMKVEVVDWAITYKDGNKQVGITLQYEFKTSWLLANINFERAKDDSFIVNGVHVRPAQGSLAEIYKTKVYQNNSIYYALLPIYVAIPIFIIVTVIYCLRAPIKKRKWLWAIFVLVGFGQVSINLHSGLVNINPLSVYLFGVGFMSPTKYGPWILIMTMPLGAIMFWVRRAALIKRNDPRDGRLSEGTDSQDRAGLTE